MPIVARSTLVSGHIARIDGGDRNLMRLQIQDERGQPIRDERNRPIAQG